MIQKKKRGIARGELTYCTDSHLMKSGDNVVVYGLEKGLFQFYTVMLR
jgi:hypothetical protein